MQRNITDARDLAQKMREAVRDGLDPSALLTARDPNKMTFRVYAEELIEANRDVLGIVSRAVVESVWHFPSPFAATPAVTSGHWRGCRRKNTHQTCRAERSVWCICGFALACPRVSRRLVTYAEELNLTVASNIRPFRVKLTEFGADATQDHSLDG